MNHSLWFGYGDLYTNTIEGLWSQIKRLSKNFTGTSISKLNKNFKGNSEKISYLNGWICYSLMVREIERKTLNRNDRINLLYII